MLSRTRLRDDSSRPLNRYDVEALSRRAFDGSIKLSLIPVLETFMLLNFLMVEHFVLRIDYPASTGKAFIAYAQP